MQGPDQFAVGVGLVIKGIQHGAAHAAQIAVKPGSPVDFCPDRQQIDAVPHHARHAARRLTRHWQADHDIRRIGSPRHIKFVGGEQQVHESCPLRACKFAQARGQIGRDCTVDARTLCRPGAGARMIGGQIQHGHGPGKLAQPILTGRRSLGRAVPFRLGAGIINDALRRRQQGCAPLQPRRIHLADITHHHVNRPAIADDVMGGDDQMMLGRPKSHQMRAHKGARHHIKRRFHLVRKDSVQRRGAVLVYQGRQIHQRHRDGQIRLDMHFHPVIREGGPEGIMTAEHSLCGGPERIPVYRAMQFQGDAFVIGGGHIRGDDHRGPYLALCLGGGNRKCPKRGRHGSSNRSLAPRQ